MSLPACNGLFLPCCYTRKAQADQSHPPGTEREQKKEVRRVRDARLLALQPPPSLNQRYIPGIKSTQLFLSQMQAVTSSTGEIQA